MATLVRELYEVLGCFSTATQTRMCDDLLRQLKGSGDNNLAKYFSDALIHNADFCQIECPFIPANRIQNNGTNPVAALMKKASPLSVEIAPTERYEFSYVQREVPHLRAMTQNEQPDKAWIDYVARSGHNRPILGEIKWNNDQNSFYAFIQLLTYLSEIATPHQIARSIRHGLFGEAIKAISTFDLHIVLVNFNEKGDKWKLIEPTRGLASAFKERLQKDHSSAANVLGNMLCISGHIEPQSECFSEIECLWMV